MLDGGSWKACRARSNFRPQRPAERDLSQATTLGKRFKVRGILGVHRFLVCNLGWSDSGM